MRLLLLAVVLPKGSGHEALRRIRELEPGVRALFVSGYPAELLERRGTLAPGTRLLMKPVPAEELLRVVREALDAPA